MFGLMGGLVFGLANGLTAGLVYGSAKGLTAGLIGGLSNIFTVGAAFGLLTRLAEPSAEAVSSIDPQSLWRRERQRGLKAGLVFGLTAGLVYGLANGVTYGLVFKVGLKADLVAAFVGMLTNALTFGLGVVLASSTTFTAMLASAQLRRRGKTPVRLLSFLEDAHAREVLRCVGPIYQFRHARLQDRLAEV